MNRAPLFHHQLPSYRDMKEMQKKSGLRQDILLGKLIVTNTGDIIKNKNYIEPEKFIEQDLLEQSKEIVTNEEMVEIEVEELVQLEDKIVIDYTKENGEEFSKEVNINYVEDMVEIEVEEIVEVEDK